MQWLYNSYFRPNIWGSSLADLFTRLYPLYSKLKKLSEDSLTKQPEEVFDVLEKLGEG